MREMPVHHEQTRRYGPHLWRSRDLDVTRSQAARWVVHAWPALAYHRLVDHMTTNPRRGDERFCARASLHVTYDDPLSGKRRRRALQSWEHQVDYLYRDQDAAEFFNRLYSQLKRLTFPLPGTLTLSLTDALERDRSFSSSGEWL